MAIPYYSDSKEGKNGQSDKRRRQPQASFSEVYDSEKGRDAETIDIQTRGYTRTGAPALLSMHMHDYTNQTKHA